jgi:hypothetical protein
VGQLPPLVGYLVVARAMHVLIVAQRSNNVVAHMMLCF